MLIGLCQIVNLYCASQMVLSTHSYQFCAVISVLSSLCCQLLAVNSWSFIYDTRNKLLEYLLVSLFTGTHLLACIFARLLAALCVCRGNASSGLQLCSSSLLVGTASTARLTSLPAYCSSTTYRTTWTLVSLIWILVPDRRRCRRRLAGGMRAPLL